MVCKTAQLNLTAFDDRELPDVLSREIEMHLNECSECRIVRIQLQNVSSALEALPVLEPDDFAAVRFLNRLKSKKKTAPMYRLAMAASFLVLLGFGAFFNHNRQNTANVQSPALTSSFFPMVDDSGSSDNNLFESVFVDYPVKEASK